MQDVLSPKLKIKGALQKKRLSRRGSIGYLTRFRLDKVMQNMTRTPSFIEQEII